MHNQYNDKEKRKKWLREYRIKNRKKIYKQHKEWLKRTNKSYYNPKGKKCEGLFGTCGIGRKYEKIALKLLPNSIDCNSKCFNGKWDIEWNGLKIDVKMRNLNKRNEWNFTTKKNPVADYYLFFCVENENVVKVYFIPKKVFKTALTISKINLNYDKYLLKYINN